MCVCAAALTAHLSAPAAASGAYVWGTLLGLGAIELACIAAGQSVAREVCCAAAFLVGRKAAVLRAVDIGYCSWMRLKQRKRAPMVAICLIARPSDQIKKLLQGLPSHFQHHQYTCMVSSTLTASSTTHLPPRQYMLQIIISLSIVPHPEL